MSKRHNAKYKIDRSLGLNLWGRAKSPFNKRTSRPGQHGAMPKKPSDYGTQLLAKQALKKYYANISEKKFKKYYEEAIRLGGNSTSNIIALLETRLDTVIYRSKFVPTVFAARQFINHGHVLVNGKKVNVPSFKIKVGDIVEVKEKSRQMPLVLEAIANAERNVPDYIQVDHSTMKTQLLNIPTIDEVPFPNKMKPNVVIEFYSR